MSELNSVNTLWVVFATILVFGMQNGFLLLEGGHVRAKNSINVAQKNLVDWMITTMLFLTFGFTLMYGVGVPLTGGSYPQPTDFLFQLAFSATAATIVSGGVAERLTFKGYLILVALTSGLVYPLLGRLVWGDVFNSDNWAGLSSIGFIDFAGATVVHSLGAWVALGAILAIGPRRGRFNADGTPRIIPSSNTVLSLSGALLLVFGWLGFNAGMIPVESNLLQTVLLFTLVGAAFGSLTGMVYGLWRDKGVANPDRLKTALIGGLVAGSASINHMNLLEAIIVGSIGGLIATVCAEILLKKCKLDDPLDVVSAHGASGLTGTIAVAFVAPQTALVQGSRLLQLTVQTGVGVTLLVLISSTTFFLVKTARKFVRIRVSAEEEYLGLNLTEHGAAVGGEKLKQTLLMRLENEKTTHEQIALGNNDENADLAQIIDLLTKQNEDTNFQLQESLNRFSQFAEVASDWLWETDENNRICFVTVTDSDPMTILNDQAVGKLLSDTFIFNQAMQEKVAKIISNRENFDFIEAEIPFLEENRVTIHVELRGHPVFDMNGKFRGYRGSVVDVTARKAAEARATFLAMHDELTRLPSRRALNASLPQMLKSADKNQTCVSLAGIDLDGFKKINDSFGHAIGDELLKLVASRLTQNMTGNCSVYRTGGDEFIFIINDLTPNSSVDYAREKCEQLLERLSKPYIVDTLTLEIGASIGISFYPAHNTNVRDLTRMADLALYSAKGHGKGRVVIYEDHMDRDEEMRKTMRKELENAISKNQFFFEYQPIANLSTGAIEGIETLIRWHHPERGSILPSGFIPLAEKLDFSEEIFNHVIETSCEFALDLTKHAQLPENNLKLALNLSASQFTNQDFSETLSGKIHNQGMVPAAIELELTSAGLADLSGAGTAVMHDLWSRGYTLVVDDFGSGQLPIDHLIKSAINKIKINRKLVNQLDKDERTQNIIRSVIALCNREGITVCASGVENAEQLSILRDCGCHQVQGYYIAKPMPRKKLLGWVHQNGARIDIESPSTEADQNSDDNQKAA